MFLDVFVGGRSEVMTMIICIYLLSAEPAIDIILAMAFIEASYRNLRYYGGDKSSIDELCRFVVRSFHV